MRHSLVWRIAIPYAILLLIATGGLWFYLSVYVRQGYLDERRANLLVETQVLADHVAENLLPGPPYTRLEEAARYYSETLGVRITIILPDGAVIVESNKAPQRLENHLNRPEIQRALQGEKATEMRYSDTLQTQMLYAAIPVRRDGQTLAIARMAVPLETIDQSILNMVQAGLGVTVLVTLLVIAVAVAITNYTIQPLSALTSAAQKMSSGDFIELEPPERLDEIGQLNLAFQRMAVQLSTQIHELKTERSKLTAVLANMTDGILIVDENGQVALTNPATARIFEVDENSNQSLANVLRNHQMVDLWHRCREQNEQQIATMETVPERLFVQAIATPLQGEMAGSVLMVFQDLTRLRRLEIVRRDFVSNVSHELRTPLASLKALTETLQEGALEDPPAARRFLLRMENEIDTLTQMVQELLELSRIESGKVPLRRQRLSPRALLTPAVERMQLQAERAGLSLRLECDARLPDVYADPDRMEQVLVNLLHNAVKFTPPGGEIVVSASRQQEQIVFSVRDSGVGISAENLPRIFERFYKADRARSGRGTGLGLSIARHLVEAHGGRIWAESTVNRGSTFFFSLPIA